VRAPGRASRDVVHDGAAAARPCSAGLRCRPLLSAALCDALLAAATLQHASNTDAQAQRLGHHAAQLGQAGARMWSCQSQAHHRCLSRKVPLRQTRTLEHSGAPLVEAGDSAPSAARDAAPSASAGASSAAALTGSAAAAGCRIRSGISSSSPAAARAARACPRLHVRRPSAGGRRAPRMCWPPLSGMQPARCRHRSAPGKAPRTEVHGSLARNVPCAVR